MVKTRVYDLNGNIHTFSAYNGDELNIIHEVPDGKTYTQQVTVGSSKVNIVKPPPEAQLDMTRFSNNKSGTVYSQSEGRVVTTTNGAGPPPKIINMSSGGTEHNLGPVSTLPNYAISKAPTLTKSMSVPDLSKYLAGGKQ